MINFELLSFNLTNPTLLFFILGVFAKYVKSDLEVPAASKNFISLYLLFSIGFNGGSELAVTGITTDVVEVAPNSPWEISEKSLLYKCG
jgi:hypothetical protein